MFVTPGLAAVHGHLGQHQVQYPDGSPVMDDPGLIFFERVSFILVLIFCSALTLYRANLP